MAKGPKKVLIIADSMATPREELKYTQTWIFKLTQTFPGLHFIDRSKRGRSSRSLKKKSSLEDYDPNYVIMHLGICDCAPRHLKKTALPAKLVNNLPARMKKIVYPFIKRCKPRRMRNANVDLKEFEENYKDYILRAKKKSIDILCFLISPVGESFQNKSPEIQIAIEAYNNVLISLDKKYAHFTTVELFTQKSIGEYLLADDHHINASGHDIFYNEITDFLENEGKG